MSFQTVFLLFGHIVAVVAGIGLPMLGLSFLAKKLDVWQDGPSEVNDRY